MERMKGEGKTGMGIGGGIVGAGKIGNEARADLGSAGKFRDEQERDKSHPGSAASWE